MDLDNFDLIEYLEDRGIDYGLSGTKDVGKGWIGISCPFPNCSDRAKHCGINKKSKLFHCHICGENGDIIKLISQIEGISFGKAMSIVLKYPLAFPDDEDEKPRLRLSHGQKVIPDHATKIFPPIHLQYLESRGFNPEQLIEDYDLYAVYTIGRYRGRIIIPMILNRRIVSFTTRDITGEADLKYIDCPEEQSIIPCKETLYNIDRLPEYGRGILVEGVTDVWRMGSGSVASNTANLTDKQKLLLAKKKLKRLFVMYDPDAEDKARRLVQELNAIIPTELIILPDCDPGDLTPDEARSIRKDLGIV